jgi:hypothetical protein
MANRQNGDASSLALHSAVTAIPPRFKDNGSLVWRNEEVVSLMVCCVGRKKERKRRQGDANLFVFDPHE